MLHLIVTLLYCTYLFLWKSATKATWMYTLHMQQSTNKGMGSKETVHTHVIRSYQKYKIMTPDTQDTLSQINKLIFIKYQTKKDQLCNLQSMIITILAVYMATVNWKEDTDSWVERSVAIPRSFCLRQHSLVGGNRQLCATTDQQTRVCYNCTCLVTDHCLDSTSEEVLYLQIRTQAGGVVVPSHPLLKVTVQERQVTLLVACTRSV